MTRAVMVFWGHGPYRASGFKGAHSSKDVLLLFSCYEKRRGWEGGGGLKFGDSFWWYLVQ